MIRLVLFALGVEPVFVGCPASSVSLGVTLTEEGVSDSKMVERIKKAKKRSRCTEKARGVYSPDIKKKKKKGCLPMVYIQRGQSDYISP